MRGSAGARGDRRLDVGLLAQRQHEAAHQAHDARHLGERDRDDHVLDARLGQRHQRDREQHRRDRHQPVHHAHHDRVEPAHVAGDEPDRQADDRREQRDGDADDERHARAVDDAAVDVAAEHVGAEPVLAPTAACRRLTGATACGSTVPSHGAKTATSDHADEHHAADERRRMAPERIAEAPPRRRHGPGGRDRRRG